MGEPKGLYDKYNIPNGTFLLKPENDLAARAAILAYAEATDDEQLASDLIKWVDSQVDKELSKAEKVVARWAMHVAIEAWTENGWGEYLPDVGEYSYERICVIAAKLLPTPPTTDQYIEAYKTLSTATRAGESYE